MIKIRTGGQLSSASRRGLGETVTVLRGLRALPTRNVSDVTALRVKAPLKLSGGPTAQVGPFSFPLSQIDGPGHRSTVVMTTQMFINWTQVNKKPIGEHPLLRWLTQKVGNAAINISRACDTARSLNSSGLAIPFCSASSFVDDWNGWGFPDRAWRPILDGSVPLAHTKHHKTGERWGLFLSWEHDKITVTLKPDPPGIFERIVDFLVSLVMIIVNTVKALIDVLKGALCALAKTKMTELGKVAAGKATLTPDQKNDLAGMGVNASHIALMGTAGATITSAVVTQIATQISSSICPKAPAPGTKPDGFPVGLVLLGGAALAVGLFLAVR